MIDPDADARPRGFIKLPRGLHGPYEGHGNGAPGTACAGCAEEVRPQQKWCSTDLTNAASGTIYHLGCVAAYRPAPRACQRCKVATAVGDGEPLDDHCARCRPRQRRRNRQRWWFVIVLAVLAWLLAGLLLGVLGAGNGQPAYCNFPGTNCG